MASGVPRPTSLQIGKAQDRKGPCYVPFFLPKIGYNETLFYREAALFGWRMLQCPSLPNFMEVRTWLKPVPKTIPALNVDVPIRVLPRRCTTNQRQLGKNRPQRTPNPQQADVSVAAIPGRSSQRQPRTCRRRETVPGIRRSVPDTSQASE